MALNPKYVQTGLVAPSRGKNSNKLDGLAAISQYLLELRTLPGSGSRMLSCTCTQTLTGAL